MTHPNATDSDAIDLMMTQEVTPREHRRWSQASFRRLTTAAAIVAACALVGCGDDGDGESATGATITQAEFVTQANAICQTGADELDAINASSDLAPPDFFYEEVVPSIRSQIAELRALGFPEGDEELLAAIFDDTDKVLDELETKADPFGSGDPFEDLNGRMREYGLTACADG